MLDGAEVIGHALAPSSRTRSPPARGCSAPTTPTSLASRNNLASAYQSAGDLAQAIPLLQDTLAASERVLGEEHPISRTVRINLDRATQAAEDSAAHQEAAR